MQNYDNFFLPVENMAEAKAFYGEVLGLAKKLIFQSSAWWPTGSATRSPRSS